MFSWALFSELASLFVYLLAGLCNNCLTGFHKIRCKVGS